MQRLSRALLVVACLAFPLALMGAFGGSYKANVTTHVCETTSGVSVSATYPVTVTNADIALEEIHLGHASAFSAFVKITNTTSASASIKIQFKNPSTGDWEDEIDTDGTANVHNLLTFTAAVDGIVPITDLPVCRIIRFVCVHDTSDNEYAVEVLTVNEQ
jgi:hypothetical protein